MYKSLAIFLMLLGICIVGVVTAVAVYTIIRKRTDPKDGPEFEMSRRMTPGARALALGLMAANGAAALALLSITPDLLQASGHASAERFAATVISAGPDFLSGAGMALATAILTVAMQVGYHDATGGGIQGGRYERFTNVGAVALTALGLLMSVVSLMVGGDKLYRAFVDLNLLFGGPAP